MAKVYKQIYVAKQYEELHTLNDLQEIIDEWSSDAYDLDSVRVTLCEGDAYSGESGYIEVSAFRQETDAEREERLAAARKAREKRKKAEEEKAEEEKAKLRELLMKYPDEAVGGFIND